jgi:hypothetical protein
LELRTQAGQYYTLFSLMLSTGLPELQSMQDLKCNPDVARSLRGV